MTNPNARRPIQSGRPKLLISNRLHDEVLATLTEQCEVLMNMSATPWSHQQLLQELETHQPDAALVFMSDCVNDEILRASKNLRLVAAALKGTNNIDADLATELGVCVTYVPGMLTEPTAELTLTLMLMQARQIPQASRWVKSGNFKGWEPKFYGNTLFRAKVGILGYGAIGQELSKLLQPFSAQVKFFDPNLTTSNESHAQSCTMEEIVTWSDYLVLALPYTSQTHHLINKDVISRMRNDAVLVNTARGSIVKESDVADALAANRLAGYVADVFEMEDWAIVDRPREIDQRLLDDDRVVLTPHIGSAVAKIRQQIEMQAAQSVLAYFSGDSVTNCLNPQVLG